MAVSNKRTLEVLDRRTPEQKLWLAVLGTAAQDAVDNSRLWTRDGLFRPHYVRSMDQEYFLNPNRSFYTVCHYAGLDPEYVIRKMKRALCQEK